jgi:hypothetical protein
MLLSRKVGNIIIHRSISASKSIGGSCCRLHIDQERARWSIIWAVASFTEKSQLTPIGLQHLPHWKQELRLCTEAATNMGRSSRTHPSLVLCLLASAAILVSAQTPAPQTLVSMVPSVERRPARLQLEPNRKPLIERAEEKKLTCAGCKDGQARQFYQYPGELPQSDSSGHTPARSARKSCCCDPPHHHSSTKNEHRA